MDRQNENTNSPQPDEEVDWETHFLDEYDEEWEKEKKRKNKRRTFIIKTGSILIVFALLISGLQIWFNLFNIPAIEFVKVSQQLSQDPDVREYKKSVVTIEWDGVKGTGFNIQPDGLIVTNEHVVNHSDTVQVYFKSGGPYLGKVISKNPELDLAIVDIEAENMPVLPLSYEKHWSKTLGEKILFIGNPLSFTQIANEGTIAGEILLQGWNEPVMMIDAPVYRGNSGSPVINQNGEVIGVVFATISATDERKRMGVATPTYYLEDILENELE